MASFSRSYLKSASEQISPGIMRTQKFTQHEPKKREETSPVSLNEKFEIVKGVAVRPQRRLSGKRVKGNGFQIRTHSQSAKNLLDAQNASNSETVRQDAQTLEERFTRKLGELSQRGGIEQFRICQEMFSEVISHSTPYKRVLQMIKKGYEHQLKYQVKTYHKRLQQANGDSELQSSFEVLKGRFKKLAEDNVLTNRILQEREDALAEMQARVKALIQERDGIRKEAEKEISVLRLENQKLKEQAQFSDEDSYYTDSVHHKGCPSGVISSVGNIIKECDESFDDSIDDYEDCDKEFKSLLALS